MRLKLSNAPLIAFMSYVPEVIQMKSGVNIQSRVVVNHYPFRLLPLVYPFMSDYPTPRKGIGNYFFAIMNIKYEKAKI